jgi:hypothetical protein
MKTKMIDKLIEDAAMLRQELLAGGLPAALPKGKENKARLHAIATADYAKKKVKR